MNMINEFEPLSSWRDLIRECGDEMQALGEYGGRTRLKLGAAPRRRVESHSVASLKWQPAPTESHWKLALGAATGVFHVPFNNKLELYIQAIFEAVHLWSILPPYQPNYNRPEQLVLWPLQELAPT